MISARTRFPAHQQWALATIITGHPLTVNEPGNSAGRMRARFNGSPASHTMLVRSLFLVHDRVVFFDNRLLGPGSGSPANGEA